MPPANCTERELPLSLYVHFPWCIRKCPYCDFNSHTARGQIPQQRYIRALLRDLDYELQNTQRSRRLHSIFFGGGTPSLFDASSLRQLIAAIAQRFEFDRTTEITLESNPGGLEYPHFCGYLEAGINRLSIGVQSFHPRHLTALGRIHTGEHARQAIIDAGRAGFTNINLDLMFALGDQTRQDSEDDLQTALQFAPDHLSLYQLTIEPNTRFYRFPPRQPDEDSILEMQQRLQRHLRLAGLQQYEVSAYARPDRECRHNVNYWQFGDYIGIGAGAHGKSTDRRAVSRNWKIKHPEAYMRALESDQKHAQAGRRTLDAEDLRFEFILNAFRLKRGFNRPLYEARSGQDWRQLLAALQMPFDAGLVETDSDTLRCSAKGYLLLDEILRPLLPESNQAGNRPA